jgi:deoxyribodipyrimidine photo-lyase
MSNNGLFIFRRDLRVVDNTTLYLLNEQCKHIYAIFIFTPEQVTSKNQFKSDNAIQFMMESLEELDINCDNGKLHTFYGNNERVIAECIRAWKIDVLGFNADYSPYAIERDEGIAKLCHKMGVHLIREHDYYLHVPGTILTSSGNKPYQKFTPYYESAIRIRPQPPKRARNIHFVKGSTSGMSYKITLSEARERFVKRENPAILVHGGRTHAIELLKSAVKTQFRYFSTRDQPSKPTSLLSASIKFGCVSIREVYATFKSNHTFTRQLYWRDFYANILFSFPHVLGNAMKPNYQGIRWHHNTSWFKAWCKGQTGFPIVDAGMRQLNETGYMHNRVRLIVASFLTKTLLISWEYGEMYFARKLTDYDPASNNGNWQWIASTGADSQPYFRIFNPTEQGKTVDPECEYIKTWIPELRELTPRQIHNWTTTQTDDTVYPKPICDYKKQKELALKMYDAVFE